MAIAVNAARILITQGEIYSLQIPKIVVHVHTNLFMNALTFVVRQCNKYRQCSLVLPVVASVRPIWGYALPYEGALIPWPGQILVPTMRILHQKKKSDTRIYHVNRLAPWDEPLAEES